MGVGEAIGNSETQIQKAIRVTELEKDLAQLTAQAQAIQGAIQYIKQKIAGLTKPEETRDEKPL